MIIRMIKRRSFSFLVCAGVILIFLPALAAGQAASLLRDINTTGNGGTGSGDIVQNLRVVGDRLYFISNGGGVGPEMWVSDGTPTGTEVLRDLCPGGCSFNPNPLGGLGNLMLWTAIDTTGLSYQLWRSDGTRPGTFSLTDVDVEVDVAPPFSGPLHAFFQGSLYFAGCAGSGVARDCDLWRTDGSVAGTQKFHEAPRSISWMFVAGDRLYYLAEDDLDFDLWVTDGTAAGTIKLRHFEGEFDAPRAPAAAGGRLFFQSRDESVAVWTSDGTVAGTLRLTNFPVHPFGFSQWLKVVGDRVYFVADDGVHGAEIWRTDGTMAGTLRMTEIANPRPFSESSPSLLVVVGGRAVFKLSDGVTRPQLWVTQGTPESTAPLETGCADCLLDFSPNLVASGGKAFFLMQRVSGTELWVTDGTTAGSHRVLEQCGCSSGPFLPWQGGIVFPVVAFPNDQIWFSDGTPAGTGPYLQPAGADPVTNPFELVEKGGDIYFVADGESRGLWVQDKPGETRPVFKLPVTGPTSDPRRLTAFGNRLLFTALDNPSSSGNLWSSSGTPATTAPVSTPAILWDKATGLMPAAGAFFFQVGSDGEVDLDGGPHDLWRTDGTSRGTFLVAHLQAKAVMVPYQGALYFFDGGGIWKTHGTVAGAVKTGDLPAEVVRVDIAAPGPNGIYLKTVTAIPDGFNTEFWFTDGTSTGTRQLTHLDPVGAGGGDPEFTIFGSSVYFSWGDLWKTDGTAAGTVRVNGLLGLPAGESPVKLLVHQGSLYFFSVPAPSSNYELGLWRTDGTAAGIVPLGRFPNQDTHFFPLKLTPFAGKLYFNVDDGIHGIELWATDGTPAGTALVRDLYPGPRSSSPTQLTVAGNRFYFVAGDDLQGIELWQSDGTSAGTHLVQDIGPQAASSAPDQLTVVGGKLFFTADDGVTGREVWVLPLTGPASCQPSSTRLCLDGGR